MTIWWVVIWSFVHSLESIRQCGVALCIVLGFSILSASIGSSVVRDRVTGAKRLQHISGLGYRTYWLINFLYDMVGFGYMVLIWIWRWKGPCRKGLATAEALILLTESIPSGCLYGASSGIQDCFMKGRLRNQGLEISEIKGPLRNTLSLLGREWVSNSLQNSLSKGWKVRPKKKNIRSNLVSISLTFALSVSAAQVW